MLLSKTYVLNHSFYYILREFICQERMQSYPEIQKNHPPFPKDDFKKYRTLLYNPLHRNPTEHICNRTEQYDYNAHRRQILHEKAVHSFAFKSRGLLHFLYDRQAPLHE